MAVLTLLLGGSCDGEKAQAGQQCLAHSECSAAPRTGVPAVLPIPGSTDATY